MKYYLFALSLTAASFSSVAQISPMGDPVSWKKKVAVTKRRVDMPTVDNAVEKQNETARRAAGDQKNLRFGKELEVDVDFMANAEAVTLPNGDVLRQLIVRSTGALSINLIFSKFELPTGARLYIFDKGEREFIGAHTSLNNNSNKVLGTELIHSDEVVIELIEPANVAGTSILRIGTVVHGFLDLEAELKNLNDSGDCMYDVNCPIGAGWENQRNATAMMVNGGGFCTGSLVNNTSGSIIPYFLSANHCGTNPGGWVFRFRWESPAAQADCATSAPSVDGPATMNVNGGVLRATYADSDFSLTELNTMPDPAWGIYYNGWDRSGIAATAATGIHHPSGDIKKISFENEALISTTFGSCPPDSHWGVTGWDEGVTEGGSSGSPLFDQNHRTIGQLHGGASQCGGAQLSDEYGKFSVSWDGNGTSATRLSDWLDPANTGDMFIDGVDPAGPGAPNDAAVNNLQGVSGTMCSGVVDPSVTITNNGTDPLTSATINYGFDGDLSGVYTWTGSLNQYQFQTISLPQTTVGAGAHTFQAVVSNPNGVADTVPGNNTTSSAFTTIISSESVTLNLEFDCWGSEVTWQIKDNLTNAVVYVSNPYADNNNPTPITQSLCLNPGCYKFILNDSYGDGFAGGWGCSAVGQYTLTNNENSMQLAGLTEAQANFGSSNTQTFCVGNEGLEEMNAMQQAWSIYPNPASTVMTIEMSALEGVKQITIMSASGQVINEMTSQAGQAAIAVDNLAKGVYFVRMTSANGTTTKTVVIR